MVQQIQQHHNIAPMQPTKAPAIQQEEKSNIPFSSILKNAIQQVNQVQKTSDAKTEKLASGGADELHNVMLSAQKASITLETAVQIQQKVIDTYNEMMRMQV